MNKLVKYSKPSCHCDRKVVPVVVRGMASVFSCSRVLNMPCYIPRVTPCYLMTVSALCIHTDTVTWTWVRKQQTVHKHKSIISSNDFPREIRFEIWNIYCTCMFNRHVQNKFNRWLFSKYQKCQHQGVLKCISRKAYLIVAGRSVTWPLGLWIYWPLKLICAIIPYSRYPVSMDGTMELGVHIWFHKPSLLRIKTTLPIRPSVLMRQLQSRLHLQHGVAGKEARCPSEQGEVSYSSSWPLNETNLIWHIILSVSPLASSWACTPPRIWSRHHHDKAKFCPMVS